MPTMVRPTSPSAPGAPGTPWVTAALFALLALFAAGIWFGMLSLNQPQPLPASASAGDFSAERARQHLAAIAAAPHPLGSPAHAEVRDYLMRELAALGLQPQLQRTTGANQSRAPILIAGSVENIVARLPGSSSRQTIMIAAHYDSVPTGPGVNDDGVAVAGMLETIRALRAGAPLQNDLVFLFSDGEEPGLLGAEAFIREHPWAAEVDTALNFEARGSRGPTLMFETSPGNAALIDALADAPYPVGSSLFGAIYKQLPNDTDFTIFQGAGMAGLNFAYIDGEVDYHASTDMAANDRNLQHHGELMLSLARILGDRPGPGAAGEDAIYFNLGALPLIRYPQSIGLALAGIASLIALGALILGFRRRRLSAPGLALGAAGLLIGMILAALGVMAVWFGVKAVVGAYDRFDSDVYGSAVYFIGFAILTIAIVAMVYRMLARRTRVANLAAGALIWWLLMTILSAVALPGASYLFGWPLLIASLGLGAGFLRPTLDAAELPGVALLSVAALPGIALFSPTIALVFIALTLAMPIPGVIMTTFAAGLIVPWLVAAGRPARGIPLIAALLLGVGVALAGGLGATFDAAHPIPSSLAYALNADTGESWWLSEDEAPNEWTSAFLGDAPASAPLKDFYPYGTRSILRHAAPALAMPAPTAILLDDSTSGGVRTLRLRLASPRKAPEMLIYAAEPTTILTATINAMPFRHSGGAPLSVNGRWALRYWAPGDGFDLTVGVPAGQPLDLILVDLSYALPDPLPDGLPARLPRYQPTPFGGIPQTLVRASVRF